MWLSLCVWVCPDRAGTVAAAVVGGALLVLSYLIFSISSSFPALLASYVFVGIGSGSTYQGNSYSSVFCECVCVRGLAISNAARLCFFFVGDAIVLPP